MIRVIIESPYAGDVERNKKYLQRCIRFCLRNGESPYASHQMLTEALDDNDPIQRHAGIAAGFAWADSADFVRVFGDYDVSYGMRKAIAEHHRVGRVVISTMIGTNENPEEGCE